MEYRHPSSDLRGKPEAGRLVAHQEDVFLGAQGEHGAEDVLVLLPVNFPGGGIERQDRSAGVGDFFLSLRPAVLDGVDGGGLPVDEVDLAAADGDRVVPDGVLGIVAPQELSALSIEGEKSLRFGQEILHLSLEIAPLHDVTGVGDGAVDVSTDGREVSPLAGFSGYRGRRLEFADLFACCQVDSQAGLLLVNVDAVAICAEVAAGSGCTHEMILVVRFQDSRQGVFPDRAAVVGIGSTYGIETLYEQVALVKKRCRASSMPLRNRKVCVTEPEHTQRPLDDGVL